MMSNIDCILRDQSLNCTSYVYSITLDVFFGCMKVVDTTAKF